MQGASVTAPRSFTTCRPRSRHQDGFALVVVIWAIGLLSLLFATYVGAARYRSIETASLVRRARADALVEAGINIAILDLLLGQAAGQAGGPRFGRSGRLTVCTAAHTTRLAIAITDEGGKVDLNTGSAELIEALLTGRNRESGLKAARDILSLRAAASAAQQQQGMVSAARPAFRSVLELDQLGITGQSAFPALLPLVTVHSGTTGVDPAVAPADVLRTLSPGGASSRAEARRALPSAFIADSRGTTFLISVEALASGARASRDAVVELSSTFAAGYRIHEQRNGSLRLVGSEREELLPC